MTSTTVRQLLLGALFIVPLWGFRPSPVSLIQTSRSSKLLHHDGSRRRSVVVKAVDDPLETDGQRRALFQRCVAASATVWIGAGCGGGGGGLLSLPAAQAFEGGVGGLGKTKPATGVEFFGGTDSTNEAASSSPALVSAQGRISAELAVQNQPVLVAFQTPSSWPLLSTTSGLEARDLAQPESAFVQVFVPPIDDGEVDWSLYNTVEQTSKKQMAALIQASVLSQQGKFGAYGSPTDLKVQVVPPSDAVVAAGGVPSSSGVKDMGVYRANFTTLTPGLRESERSMLVRAFRVAASSSKGNAAWVLLIAGTTRLRFNAQQNTLTNIVESFEVIPAPPSRLR